MRVVFRAAAGPLTGYGHLRRVVSLAAALRVPPVVSLRGGKAAAAVARDLGCTVIRGSAHAVIAARRPSLVVVDDPVRSAGLVWVRAARRGHVFVAGVADAGIGCVDGDVLIDGSAAAQRRRGPGLCGPRYAILDPGLRGARRRSRRRDTVLIALGGGSRQRLAAVTARELSRYGITVRIAPGFTKRPPCLSHRSHPSHQHVSTIAPSAFTRELATCAVAIVGGGVTLYEACALGTPSIAVPVVAAQRQAIHSCAARGAVVDGSTARPSSLALGLLASRGDRVQLARAATRLVDGGGAARVARELRRRAQ
jgi:spore coat polysaccharide biosynthesis predicted glycosyltransferase SpsG